MGKKRVDLPSSAPEGRIWSSIGKFFREDPLLEEALKGEVAAPKTIGDWLRDFTAENNYKMNVYLRDMARTIRRQLIEIQTQAHQPNKALVIDMDSTDHEQSGEKIQGCAYNYKNIWGLYSEVAFDELGFCHAVQLAAGNTKPGSTCVPLIEHCFSGLKFTDEKYFRADSGYSWQDPIKTLIRLGVTYVDQRSFACSLSSREQSFIYASFIAVRVFRFVPFKKS